MRTQRAGHQQDIVFFNGLDSALTAPECYNNTYNVSTCGCRLKAFTVEIRWRRSVAQTLQALGLAPCTNEYNGTNFGRGVDSVRRRTLQKWEGSSVTRTEEWTDPRNAGGAFWYCQQTALHL